MSPTPLKGGDKECIKKETLNSDSGYFEGDEEGGDIESSREGSVEIIFDKNATNNNVGQDGKSPNTGKCRPPVLFI